MRELIEQILRRTAHGEAVAVCTVVRTQGSTPQSSGAAMLVLADGRTLGTIGGGCVEAEVRTQALRLMAANADRLLTFRLDHDYGWDDGLVCGGTMDVAVQTVTSPADWQPLHDALAPNQPAELSIAVPTETGEMKEFRVPVPATPTLWIVGAGHVGQALAQIAATLDFRLTVLDDRADTLTADRFPAATRVVADIEQALRATPPGPEAYAVIVTRGHRHDAAALAAVLTPPAPLTPPRYVGVIGSRRKILHIFRDLRAAGTPDAILARVHAPIGLDLGALTPHEIAVSIAAELIAVRRGRPDAVRPLRIDPTLWRDR